MRGFALSLLALMTVAQPGGSPIRDSEAYAIYNGIMSSTWLALDITEKVLLIQDVAEPTRVGPCELPIERMTDAWREAVAAHTKASANPGVWQENFTIKTPYRIVAKSELWGFFGPTVMDGWTPFFVKYPDARGFIELSPVGFDTRTHAVIYVSHHCGGLCGGGGYGFLEKENGVWRGSSPFPPGSSYCRWMS
jgi:hypothetical protein